MKRSTNVILAIVAITLLSIGLILPTQRVSAASFIVTSTADTGGLCPIPTNCTLRQAINMANATPGLDTITFAIGVVGSVQTISPFSPLPAITDPIFIDGWSQGGAGYTGSPLIELNGNLFVYTGLDLAPGSAGSLLQGLVINQFGNNGVTIETDNNRIQGCYIGTDPTGTLPKGNAPSGIYVHSAASTANNNIIGTNGDGVNDAAERNVIASNAFAGIELTASANFTVIAGNYIGTNASGNSVTGMGNVNGVYAASSNNRIGTNNDGQSDTLEGNVISGNGSAPFGSGGIELQGSSNDVIAGNYIGTDRTNTLNLGNYSFGIYIVGGQNNLIGGPSAVTRNYIRYTPGNLWSIGGMGIFLDGSSPTILNTITNNEISNNYWYGIISLGTERDGVSSPPGNGPSDNTFTNNLITNNDHYGIVNIGSSPLIQGNTIQNNGGEGIHNQPAYGASPDPATANDDYLSRPIIGGGGNPNIISGNCKTITTTCAGIMSLDTMPTNEATLETDNIPGANNGAFFIEQRWYGAVEVINGSTPVGTTVTLTSANGGPTYIMAANSGVCPNLNNTILNGITTPSCTDVTTWTPIIQYVVTAAGTRISYSPQVATAPGIATYSFDGNAATNPTDSGVGFIGEGIQPFGFPWSRYQIMELHQTMPSSTPFPTFTRTFTPTTTPSYTPSATLTPTITLTPSVTLTPIYTYTSTYTFTPSNTFTPSKTLTRTSTTTYTFTPSNTPTRTITPTFTPSLTLTSSNTSTFTPIPSNTSTAMPSPTYTDTPTNTSTPTFTFTPTSTLTPSATYTDTATFTPTPSNTNTSTVTQTASATFTNTPTNTSTPTFTFTPTSTLTPSATYTDTATFTPTPSNTNTSTATQTASATFTNTPTNTSTTTFTFTPTSTNTSTATFTTTPSSTNTLTQTATLTSTNTATSTGTVTPTFTFTSSSTPTNTLSPTMTYTPSITYTPSVTFTPSMTYTPSATFTASATSLAPTVTETVTEIAILPTPQPALTIFDPAISKIGMLPPGSLGVPGEKIAWQITVWNRGSVPGSNVTVVDSLRPEFRIESVTTSKGSFNIKGQTVTFSIGTLLPGETVNMVIIATVLQNPAVTELMNQACLYSTSPMNNPAPRCADGVINPPLKLPDTGYKAIDDKTLIVLAGTIGVIIIGLVVLRRLSKRW